jgi:hypothetical protein
MYNPFDFESSASPLTIIAVLIALRWLKTLFVVTPQQHVRVLETF